MRVSPIVFCALVCAFSLDGCGSGSSTLMPTGTQTPPPIGTPTVPSSATPTPQPTTTPTPQPTSTPTPTPTSTALLPNFTAPPALNEAVPPPPPTYIPIAPAGAPRVAHYVAPKKRADAPTVAASSLPIVKFATTLGDINVQLRPDVAPKNVANFLSYVNDGSYALSIIHRSVPGFIIQGGGYTFTNSTANAITQQAPVVNEFGVSNTRGTLAMAKSGSNPDSATSQFFFNQANNASTLDTQSGGYTVIGNIVDSQGLAVMDAINALPDYALASPFDQIPLINYTSGASIQANNVVFVTNITPVAPHPSFFAGEQSLANAVYYLGLPNGNYFGYYSYLSNPSYIYHFDLGYEYAIDANDGMNGIYFYDFTSGHYFYTSPSFPFPYVYDFSLKSVLYYYPDPSNAGHYTSGTRYFYNFSTKSIISE